MERNIYIENMPLEKASELFMERLTQSGYFADYASEYLEVMACQGRITSSAVFARRSSPHYLASAMDGIAVNADATYSANEFNPVNLKHSKEYIEVDTGDYVPSEFNAVIMIEDVNFVDDCAQIIKPAVPWQHIRSVGEDLVAHDMIVPSLYKLGPCEVASFITGGVEKVAVIKQPRVAIIPTGTEMLETASKDMPPGCIVESNSRMLSGLCREWGAIPIRHNIVIDDKELLRQAVSEVKDDADMIIICSGSSAGREDYTSSIINEFGEVLVHGIAIKPGKPAILGIIDNKPVIGVPGYPVSAQLVFNLFAKSVLYKKQGQELTPSDTIQALLSRKTASPMGVDEFIYANLALINDQYVAFPLNRGAGISSILVKADGIICIERGSEGINAGQSCTVSLLRSRQAIDKTLLTIGSHDMSIDILADIMQKQHGIRLISSNVGSMGGIMALRRGETHFSGIHLLDSHSGEYNIAYLNKYLPAHRWILVNLVKREQGLIVKKGNPLQIKNLSDLLRHEIRYINRQQGAGTRVLFDYLLTRENIASAAINGYNRQEYTHLAVAAAVQNDACDTGLGIYASARALDLDFIPISEERYDICILSDLISDEKLDILLNCIKSSQFLQRTKDFGGYNLELSGKIIASQ
ncbi:MAG: molybdopterin biosynthesis protein [Syntrophomonadaceae bacterium]|nr:molybdopterin biosynthesis protein [Syntrophomonadaceae bacterium]